MKKRPNELNRGFSKEEIQMVKKPIKEYSTSLAIIQIKTMLRFYLTSIRMFIIKKTDNNKCW
jgi:hypothetical protein